MRGRRRRDCLRFALAGLLFLSWASCQRGGGRLNVLLITLDTTRADYLRCYGNRQVDTPQLDRLAREGVLFETGICQIPLTLPSHSSIMTGLTPMAHGVRDNGNYRLGDGALTLAEILRERGYATAAVVAAFAVHSSFGLAQGFDVYDEDFSHGKMHDDFHFVERPADQVTDTAIHWLEGRPAGRPFFLWIHYFDPHADYAPPSPFRERYAADPYAGEIAFMDWQLGRLLDFLVERKLWDRTLVVAVGDHGESLGEHGEDSHGLLVYDPVLRIPYIVSHPESRQANPSPRWRPRRISEEVETIDLLPTLAELTGPPVAHAVEGQSLLPLLDGNSPPERLGYAETLSPYLTYGWAALRAVRTRSLKFIRAPERELYDLQADPRELHNLAAERPQDVSRLEAELARLAERAAQCAVGASGTELSLADREKLASLGYLQSGGAAPTSAELDPAELAKPDPKKMVWASTRYLTPGIDALTRDDGTEAERLFRLFLEQDPGSGEGHFYLGCALRIQGKLEPAVCELEEAGRLTPRNAKVPLTLGITYGMLGRAEESRRALERASELNPYSGEPLVMLARLAQNEGRTDEALALCDEAVKLDPGSSPFRLVRGLMLEKAGRKEEGLRELQQAVELTPDGRKTLTGVATELAQAGHAELALPLFERLVRLQPEDGGYRTDLGNCYLLGGNAAKAIEQYRVALRLAPTDARVHYLLGCAYAAANDYPRARASWQRTLELDPAHREARHNLELLQGGQPPPAGVSFP